MAADEGPARKRTKTNNAHDNQDETAKAAPSNPSIDAEMDSFLSSLATLPPPEPASKTTATAATATKKALFKSTVTEAPTSYEAAPVLIAPASSTNERSTTTISAAPSAASNPFAAKLSSNVDGPEPLPEAQQQDEEEAPEETEAEKRERLIREEREEIMDRLEEETRAQWVSSCFVFDISDSRIDLCFCRLM